ncbi:MAG: hypothetical protein U9R52_03685, partial [Candidatus Omnitrophota bacterium]|nr:hypothetical protein [Candidatus Omnitrophota bacterium]
MKRKPYRFFLYLLLKLLHVIVFILPYKAAIFLGGFFGGLAYRILARYRNVTIDNLRLAFTSEKNEDEIHRIAADVFRNLGMTAAECLSLRKFNRQTVKRFVREQDYRPLKEILSKG